MKGKGGLGEGGLVLVLPYKKVENTRYTFPCSPGGTKIPTGKSNWDVRDEISVNRNSPRKGEPVRGVLVIPYKIAFYL